MVVCFNCFDSIVSHNLVHFSWNYGLELWAFYYWSLPVPQAAHEFVTKPNCFRAFSKFKSSPFTISKRPMTTHVQIKTSLPLFPVDNKPIKI